VTGRSHFDGEMEAGVEWDGCFGLARYGLKTRNYSEKDHNFRYLLCNVNRINRNCLGTFCEQYSGGLAFTGLEVMLLGCRSVRKLYHGRLMSEAE
jgi:hypothetical protein